MCILFIAINQHSEHPLIVCANRDEIFARPTLQAHFWNDRPYLLAGKDQQAGGSWLGITTHGRFAAITNIRTGEPSLTGKRTRGELVTMALEPDSKFCLDWLLEYSDQYNPFNLVYGSLNQLCCYNSLEKKQTRLVTGYHAISNGSLDDVWPKMVRGQQHLQQLITAQKKLRSEQLFSLLTDSTQVPDTELPDTGVPLAWERKLSSIFISGQEYGTRSSSLLMLNNTGNVDFFERAYDQTGKVFEQNEYPVQIVTDVGMAK
jgi:uncharacterized protein with NRDE domain